MNPVIRWLRRCHFPLLMLLGAAPAALLLLNLWDTALIAEGFVFYGLCLLLSPVCAAFSGRRRLIAGLVGSAALMLAGGMRLPVSARISLWLIPLACSALLLLSLPMSTRHVGEISPAFFVAGLIAHLFVYTLMRTSPAYRAAGEQGAQILTLLFAAYMALFLLALNRISLDNATLGRHSATRFMRAVNTAMTLLFLALSLLLSFIPALARLLQRAWRVFCAAMTKLDEWLMSLLPHDTGMGGAPQPPAPMPQQAAEQAEPGLFSIFLEYAATALTLLALVIGLAVLLRLIARGLVRLGRYLSARLKLYVSAATEDYIDEITDTREDGVQRENRFALRIKRRSRTEAVTPAQRIRVGYARLLRRRPQWADSSTARENLPEESAIVYERARYSHHEITTEDEKRFREGLQKIE